MEFITQKKYLNNANKNYREWFINNTYDTIFIPLIARDYLTAYLMNFRSLGRTAPDIDWVLEKLENYDKEAADKFKVLDIRLKEDVKSIEYYLDILSQCKEYVEEKLR